MVMSGGTASAQALKLKPVGQACSRSSKEAGAE